MFPVTIFTKVAYRNFDFFFFFFFEFQNFNKKLGIVKSQLGIVKWQLSCKRLGVGQN